jgi:hypothetical protein
MYLPAHCVAIGPRAHRFKPGCGDGFLKLIKIHSMPSFRGEVKFSAPCHKILWHVKETCLVWQILRQLRSRTFFFPTFCFTTRCLLQAESIGRWIKSDWKWDGDAHYIRIWPQCVLCFVQYHTVTVTSWSVAVLSMYLCCYKLSHSVLFYETIFMHLVSSVYDPPKTHIVTH